MIKVLISLCFYYFRSYIIRDWSHQILSRLRGWSFFQPTVKARIHIIYPIVRILHWIFVMYIKICRLCSFFNGTYSFTVFIARRWTIWKIFVFDFGRTLNNIILFRYFIILPKILLRVMSLYSILFIYNRLWLWHVFNLYNNWWWMMMYSFIIILYY